MNKLKEINRRLQNLNYEPDAIGISNTVVTKVITSFQQEFEKPYVNISDLEIYFNAKILIFEDKESKKEFYFYSELREGDS